MQIPLVLQRFPYVSGHLWGIILFCPACHASRRVAKSLFYQCFFPRFLNDPIALLLFAQGPS